ncbi:jg5205, partial [Pararge aegeria aegeria]
IEDSEPPPKKTEVTEENTGGRVCSTAMSNGRKKRSESEKEKIKERKQEKEIVINTCSFNSDRPVECVAAFKESDSWD